MGLGRVKTHQESHSGWFLVADGDYARIAAMRRVPISLPCALRQQLTHSQAVSMMREESLNDYASLILRCVFPHFERVAAIRKSKISHLRLGASNGRLDPGLVWLGDRMVETSLEQ